MPGFLTPKSTRVNPSASKPHKVHKRLRFGYTNLGRKRLGGQWLRADGWITKPKGWSPRKFLKRKEVDFPTRTRGKATRKGRARKKGVSKMSSAAKKAWATRRKRG